MASQTFTLATIGQRTVTGGTNHDGVYKTNSRNAPAGTFQFITFTLTFTNQDTDFVPGDILFGSVELSTDSGSSWQVFCEAEWHGGTARPADPEKGTPAGTYSVMVNGAFIPQGSLYRASLRMAAGGPVSVGATATLVT